MILFINEGGNYAGDSGFRKHSSTVVLKFFQITLAISIPLIRHIRHGDYKMDYIRWRVP